MVFNFDFVDRSGEAATAVDQLSGSRYWLDDRAYPRAFGQAVDPDVADLLSIAMACYAADRLSARGQVWHRAFAIRVGVTDRDRWASVSGDLERLLTDLSGDSWSFEFVAGRAARISESQTTLFPIRLSPDDAVGLFSGGLDSLAGAVRWSESESGRLVLLGARSSTVIGRDQRLQARSLQAHYGPRLIPVRIPLSLRRSMSREKTQRTRSFVYLVLGLAAARTAGVDRLSVFENGYGAYNPRLDEHQVEAQANRGTHPHVLRLFERLAARVELPVRVVLPHAGKTKAEHVGTLPGHALSLIKMTSSCDSYPLRRAGVTHCGRCGSCVLRRQALMAAGLEEFDRTDYEYLPLDRSVAEDDIWVRSARQAWLFGRLASIQQWPEIEALWPSFALGADVRWPEQALVLRLISAQHGEWEKIMNERQWLRSGLGWPDRAAA